MDAKLPTQPHAPDQRLPAEWEPHRATWLAWPHCLETWPPQILERLSPVWAEMVRRLRRQEEVRVLVRDRPERQRVECRPDFGEGQAVSVVEVPTDDAWVRDFGPTFTRCSDGSLRAVCWQFNAWGEKYPNWRCDAAAAARMARYAGYPAVGVDTVLEGGAIDVNGQGLALTTESCLLDAGRNPDSGRRSIEGLLERFLGVTSVLWLGGGIAGDDTDGHVDEVARFVAERTVVAAVEGSPRDENYRPLRENLERLRGWRDRDGSRLDVVELPMPEPVYRDEARLPASYANFYIANGTVLVPTFRTERDARALGILAELFPGREVVGIDCTDVVVGLGGVHCLTREEPETDSEGGR